MYILLNVFTMFIFSVEFLLGNDSKTSVAFSLLANFTDWVAAAGWRS
jgi:hypothetical protein